LRRGVEPLSRDVEARQRVVERRERGDDVRGPRDRLGLRRRLRGRRLGRLHRERYRRAFAGGAAARGADVRRRLDHVRAFTQHQPRRANRVRVNPLQPRGAVVRHAHAADQRRVGRDQHVEQRVERGARQLVAVLQLAQHFAAGRVDQVEALNARERGGGRGGRLRRW
jgi:hypothetical protein